ncbi:MAG: proteinase inhibitor i78 [Asticcacaulis sp.]
MKTHRLGFMSGLSVILLAGCAATPSAPPAKPVHITAYQTPVARPAPTPPAEVYKPMAEDKCGAQPLQYLVGKPRTDIPVPLDPSLRRVVCSTCIVTQEYRNNRQTIIFNTDTGIIKSVACG